MRVVECAMSKSNKQYRLFIVGKTSCGKTSIAKTALNSPFEQVSPLSASCTFTFTFHLCLQLLNHTPFHSEIGYFLAILPIRSFSGYHYINFFNFLLEFLLFDGFLFFAFRTEKLHSNNNTEIEKSEPQSTANRFVYK